MVPALPPTGAPLPERLPWAQRYGLAAAYSIAFLALWLALRDSQVGQSPFLVLLAAPLIASWFGGWGPGALATLLCALMGQTLMDTTSHTGGWPVDSGEWVHILVFLAYGLIFSAFFEERMRRLRIASARQENLLQAQQDLALREQRMRETARRKDALVAALAHGLRRPLAPVRSAVDMMRRLDPADPRLASSREAIARQVVQMTRLIDDLLDTPQIRQGERAPDIQRCDLARIARETTEDHRTSLENTGLRLLLDTPDSPVWVDGDAVLLAQVLGNLLNNGSRSREANGLVTVEVCADAVKQRVLLRVTDTRIGLGTHFSLWLPGVDASPRTAPPIASEGSSHRQAATRRRRGLHIMLVADKPDAAAALAEVLSLDGHRVDTCHDGEAAIALAAQEPPDVIISDLALPGQLDGYQLARQLRSDPQLADLYLIALSGYADRQARLASQSAGFDAHLAKPPDLRELAGLLAQVRHRRVGEPVA